MTVSISSVPIADPNLSSRRSPDPRQVPARKPPPTSLFLPIKLSNSVRGRNNSGPFRESREVEKRARHKADARFTIPNSSTDLLLVQKTKNKKSQPAPPRFPARRHFPNSRRNPDGSPAAQRGSAVGGGDIGKARDAVKQFFNFYRDPVEWIPGDEPGASATTLSLPYKRHGLNGRSLVARPRRRR